MEEKSALRHFNKVLDVCPRCHNRDPKELVEIPIQTVSVNQFNTVAYVIIGLITCGIGFLLFPFFKQTVPKQIGGGLSVYCPNCKNPFPARI